ncbi:hypothetical protein D3C72_1355060 [compost metagenome]
MPQVQARAQLQVARVEHAFEQQHGAAPAQRAHALGLGQVEQREAVGAAQAFEDTLDAVPVGVGLDHGPDTGVDGRAAGAVEVVAQGGGVDGGENGARHGGCWGGFRPRFSIFGNGVESRGDA